ncbi:pectate lyase family protein [Saccharobesus litoralis]
MMSALYASSTMASGFHTQNGGTTGGAGGQVVYATTGTQIHEALCNRASSDTPIIIHVEGTINHGNTSKVSGDSCNTAADKIEIKEVSNISIIGVGNGALFDQLGIHLRAASNIIIQNVHVRNVKKSGSPISNGGDAIGMESDVFNVWVDHATLEASGGESAGYDALFDMKANTKYVTLSYSILRNSGRGGLVGSSDSDDSNGPVTFHHNLYQNIDSRTPLLRHATAHAYNNHYVSINESGMNPRIGGEMRAENNYFEDSKDVLGTFYTNDMGYWQVSGNIWDNITWTDDASKNHPAGPNPTSTTSVSIPYSYSLDNASCVPNIVAATAGANKGLLTSDGSCGTTGGGNDGSGSSNNGTVNGTYRITPVHSGSALDVDYCGNTNGTNIHQWGWLNNDCQKFNISSVDGIWHRISPVVAPTLGFDVDSLSTSAGANIMLWDYWGGANQQFRFQSAGSGKWRIINRNSELCLDVAGNSANAGANLHQWTCISGAENQMFELTRQ